MLEPEEVSETISRRELLAVQNRGSRVLQGWAGPVECFRLFNPVVGDTGHRWGDTPHIVPDILRRVEVESVQPEFVGEIDEDLPVFLGIAWWFDGLADTVDPPLTARERPILLGERGAWEDYVCVLGCLGHEEVLHDQEVQLLKRPHDMVRVRVGDDRVQREDVHRLDRVAALGDLLCQGHTILARKPGDAPEFLHPLPGGVVFALLVAGVDIRVSTHVAGALDVVLATERVDTDSRSPNVAGEHREVSKRSDVIRTGRELGDAKAVDDHCVVGARVHLRDLLDPLGGDAGDRLDIRVVLYGLLQIIKARGPVLDELLVVEILLDDPVHDGVDQGDVRRGVVADVLVSQTRGWGVARIADDDGLARLLRLENPACSEWVRLDAVCADHEDEIGVSDILEGIRRGTRAE